MSLLQHLSEYFFEIMIQLDAHNWVHNTIINNRHGLTALLAVVVHWVFQIYWQLSSAVSYLLLIIYYLLLAALFDTARVYVVSTIM